jgi:glutamyl-tRNA synthetase
VSVTAYEDAGYLPEAMLNYLARLGWSHGDEEIFTREQMVAWFDGSHLSKSPARWDPAKLAWVNAQYLKQADDERLAELVERQLQARAAPMVGRATLLRALALFKDRCSTVVELADWCELLAVKPSPKVEDMQTHVTPAARQALIELREALTTVAWDKASLATAMKAVLTSQGLKMPQLATPLRVLLMGRPQTPSIDAVLELFERDEVLARLASL